MSESGRGKMTDLKTRFFAMAERVESMGKGIDTRNPASLRTASATLNLIITDLASMLELGPGAATGEGEKGIMAEVSALLQQTVTLKGHLDRALAIPAVAEAAANRSTPKPPSSQQRQQQQQPPLPPQQQSQTSSSLASQVLNDSVPLSRDEIAKLLLLTSRAWKMKMVTDKQRHFIKTVIVRQEGYLRVILSLSSIKTIMSALAAVGGSDDDEEEEGPHQYGYDFEDDDDDVDDDDDDEDEDEDDDDYDDDDE